MRTLNKILTPAKGVGRQNIGTRPKDKRVYDCLVPIRNGYDKGGAYWGAPIHVRAQLRVSYTKDLKYVRFYRRFNHAKIQNQ